MERPRHSAATPLWMDGQPCSLVQSEVVRRFAAVEMVAAAPRSAARASQLGGRMSVAATPAAPPPRVPGSPAAERTPACRRCPCIQARSMRRHASRATSMELLRRRHMRRVHHAPTSTAHRPRSHRSWRSPASRYSRRRSTAPACSARMPAAARLRESPMQAAPRVCGSSNASSSRARCCNRRRDLRTGADPWSCRTSARSWRATATRQATPWRTPST